MSSSVSTTPVQPVGPLLALTGGALTTADVEDVARRSLRVELAPAGRSRMEQALRSLSAAMSGGNAIYGVNTGFGSFSRTRIPDADLRAVQHNLIRSHAAGVGELLPADVVRATMLLLAASLSRGHSAVRPAVVDTLCALLNAGIIPCVPSLGSVGASGDLAPLAHIALVLIGEGEACVTEHGRQTRCVPGAEALRLAGAVPLELGPKEGLALINGTHLMAAQGALLMSDVVRLFDAAVTAAAMSIDSCRATNAFLDERVHDVRRQPGPRRVATRLRLLLDGSQIIPSHRENDPRVQDPYSLRCAPPVLGAALDAIEYVRRIIDFELGSVTDNPLVFESGAVISAGNFHGMPLAVPLDTLAIALSHVAGISERRTYYMLAAADPEAHLRPHLAPTPGLQSGFMIAQYTAAACCNEIITLCTPASVSNIPTSAGMEDYNSFGPRSAAKARRALDLCTRVVAIELLCAAEALEYHRPLRSGHGVERAHAIIRQVVPRLSSDRPPAPDIEAICSLIRAGRFGN